LRERRINAVDSRDATLLTFVGTLRVPVHSTAYAQVPAGNPLFETLANFIAHLFAEFLPARRSFGFRNIESIKYVEIFQDRITVAGHGQDAKEFIRRSARTGDLPSPHGVRTAPWRQAAKLRHIRRRQRPADGVAEILAKLFQFRAGHGGYFLLDAVVEVPSRLFQRRLREKPRMS
jgi:hypothetical protein